MKIFNKNQITEKINISRYVNLIKYKLRNLMKNYKKIMKNYKKKKII